MRRPTGHIRKQLNSCREMPHPDQPLEEHLVDGYFVFPHIAEILKEPKK
jgi:hypothetical protein